MKEQEAKGLLSNLGIKTPLSKIQFLNIFVLSVKTNEIVNTFLLAGDQFMPEMHLKQLVLLTVLVIHLQKLKKELKSL